MKYAPRRRRNSPPPIDYIMRELHASSKRCDELLGPALQMIDERRKLSERFTTGLLVVGVAIVFFLHWLHPEWPWPVRITIPF
ncbi:MULTISPECIES: hypothetical protein [Hymenobacter]|uniref:Uncharacterized protein n=1 Tax=Hymenobacter mucosus TaxID=1411120 RepID=A0A239B9N2_9BACT|nr:MULTISPECIES: hypothetical protein [Hymenobacter]MDF7815580.1 hypothetical protein [Hymenobacter sp. YC55]SNS04570.1 hypothetical protein SAMN06269173_12018 [Hymenobacter mucosus]